MDSVLLVAPAGFDVASKLRVAPAWKITEGGQGTWVVEDGKSRVYISPNRWGREELGPERFARITSMIPDPVFFAIDFSDVELCRQVLPLVADDPRLLIDNDHGLLLSGPEFVQLLRSQPYWDWRRGPQG